MMQKAWNFGRHFNELKFKMLLFKHILQNVNNCKYNFSHLFFHYKCPKLTDKFLIGV